MNLRANRESRMGEDFHLKVSPRYRDLLNALPDFKDFTTAQLLLMVPKRYRKFIPPVGEFFAVRDHAHEKEDWEARAAIIGMLCTEEQVESHKGLMFLERTVVVAIEVEG